MDKYFETVIAEFLQLCLLASPVIQINGVHITLNAQWRKSVSAFLIIYRRWKADVKEGLKKVDQMSYVIIRCKHFQCIPGKLAMSETFV